MTSVTTTTGRPRPAARQRRMARLDRLSFMAVFLGLPLAIYLIFVIYPFGQALYYSMTDWSGFTPAYNFVGLDNFTKLFHDDIFMRALGNNVELAIVVPFVTIVLALASTMVTNGTTIASSTLLRNERMKMSSWNNFVKLS